MISIFKIADAYVEVHSKINTAGFRSAAKSISNLLIVGPALAVLSVGAVKLTAALYQMVSSLLTTLPAFAAVIPAAVGLGGALGVLMLLFKDTAGTPMERFVTQLKNMRTELQKGAMKVAADDFNRLADALQTAFPAILAYVQRLSIGIGNAARELAVMVTKTEFMDRFRDLTEVTALAMYRLFRSVDSVVDIIVTLGAAAAPIFLDFVFWLERILRQAQGWLIMKYNVGELQGALRESADELAKWGKILGNFIWGLVGFFSAGKKEGGEFSDTLLEISNRFKEWSWDEGTHGKIQELLDKIQNVNVDKMLTVAGALATIGLGIRGLLFAAEASKGIFALAEGLIALNRAVVTLEAVMGGGLLAASIGWILLLLAAMAGALIIVAGAMVFAYRESEEFRKRIDELWKKVKDELIPAIADLKKWIEEYLAPKLIELANNVLPHLERAIAVLIEAWKQNKTEIKEFVEYLVNVAVPALSGLAIVAIYILIGGLGALMFVIKLLSWVIGGLVGAFLLVRDTAYNVASSLGASLGRAIENLEGAVAGLVGSWAGAWSNLVRIVSGAVDTITGKVRDLLSIFGLAEAASGNVSKGVGRVGGSGGLGGRFGFAHGGIIGAAAGGPRGGMTLVGEGGPELVHLPAGSRVRSNPDTRAMFGGGSGLTVNLYVAGSIRSDRDIVSMLRDELTNQGLAG